MLDFFEPIEVIVHHPWLEVASWVCQIVLAAVAVIGAIFGYRTINDATKARHARLIMDLDHRWDSGEIRKARAFFGNLREDITKEISQKFPLDSDKVKLRKAKAEWTKQLAALRKADPANYRLLITICGFFESVGMMVKRDYISKEDALGLFAGSIVQIDRFMRPHLEARAKEMGVPKGFLEHALYLCDLAKDES